MLGRRSPLLSRDFAGCARSHALDLAATLFLFTGASIAAGRVWRFPFDDELIALAPVEKARSALDLAAHYLTAGDIHPPLSFLWFYALHQLGFGEAAIRLCSLAMTAFALLLFQAIALTLVVRRNSDPVPLATRLTAVLLFGLCPLAIGVGDAIRWYPVFAFFISLFVTFYLFGENRAALLLSAAALGLAASTNFIAVIVLVPFAVYRYLLQKRFEWRFDPLYAAMTLVFGAPGLVSAFAIFSKRLGGVEHTEFGTGFVQAVATDVLGFFGGTGIGLGLAWLIVPLIVISLAALFSEIDPRRPESPVHLLMLMLAASALMVSPGFAKPRSFLYLAPVLAALLTLFFDRQVRIRRAGAVVLMVALILTVPVAAVANLNGGTRPFKRNMAVPYQAILDFIAANATGRTLVVSTDPIVPWVLRHANEASDRCASYFFSARECFDGRHYDSIFIITGFSDKSLNEKQMGRWRETVDGLTNGRSKRASMYAGEDKDASLKTKLTGVRLDAYILSVDLYR